MYKVNDKYEYCVSIKGFKMIELIFSKTRFIGNAKEYVCTLIFTIMLY